MGKLRPRREKESEAEARPQFPVWVLTLSPQLHPYLWPRDCLSEVPFSRIRASSQATGAFRVLYQTCLSFPIKLQRSARHLTTMDSLTSTHAKWDQVFSSVEGLGLVASLI